MIRIRLQYDRYNGTFTLVDRELRSLLEDGALYDVELPWMLVDGDCDDSLNNVEIGPLANA